MSENTVGALIAVASVGVVIVVLVGTTRAAARGTLKRNGWAGIRVAATMRSDEAWRAGHAAAQPVVIRLCTAMAALDLVALIVLVAGAPIAATVLALIAHGLLLAGLIPMFRSVNRAANSAH